MKKVLLVTDVTFWEKSAGHSIRIAAMIEYLQNHVILTVVNTGPAPENIELLLKNSYNVDFFVLEKNKYLNSNGYGRRFKAFLKDKHFDTIIIEYIHSSYFLNFLTDDVQIILDAHDIISDRAEEFKKFNYQGALYELPRETEYEIFNIYDNVIALCEPDYLKIKSVVGANKALLCPHPIIPCKRTLREKVKKISFVASAYLPNRDAINFFISNCWPQIFEKHPDIELSIFGTVCYNLILPDTDRIRCNGFVSELDLIYDGSDIIINPVQFGAGLKIKNVEALANGIPLITTTHGARGLEKIKNKGFLVADGADDFTAAVLSLIDNLEQRRRLSGISYKFIKDNFSPGKCFSPLVNAINQYANLQN